MAAITFHATIADDAPEAQAAYQGPTPAQPLGRPAQDSVIPSDSIQLTGVGSASPSPAQSAGYGDSGAPIPFSPRPPTGAFPPSTAQVADAAPSIAKTATPIPPKSSPKETLQQVDQALEEIGINPQDVSIADRTALLVWINDPAAIQQFAQVTQPSSGQPQLNTAANTPNTADEGVPTSVTAASQSSGASQPAGLSNTSSAPPAGSTQNRSTALAQLQELQTSLGAQAGQDPQSALPSSNDSLMQGQQLNVSV
jgi:hypothetical protein